jgi:hypothetical protein
VKSAVLAVSEKAALWNQVGTEKSLQNRVLDEGDAREHQRWELGQFELDGDFGLDLRRLAV